MGALRVYSKFLLVSVSQTKITNYILALNALIDSLHTRFSQKKKKKVQRLRKILKKDSLHTL